jgi:hypothetical protein
VPILGIKSKENLRSENQLNGVLTYSVMASYLPEVLGWEVDSVVEKYRAKISRDNLPLNGTLF